MLGYEKPSRGLTLKALSKIVADDILLFFYIILQGK